MMIWRSSIHSGQTQTYTSLVSYMRHTHTQTVHMHTHAYIHTVVYGVKACSGGSVEAVVCTYISICVMQVIIISFSLILGVFYYTLGNLHPKHRSTLDGICLLAIVKVPVIQAYGLDAILEPIVDAIQKLGVCRYIRTNICAVRIISCNLVLNCSAFMTTGWL